MNMYREYEIFNLAKKYQTEKAYIIGRKKEDLYFSILAGIVGHGIDISIYGNELTIDAKQISISNIKTIYLTVSRQERGTYCHLYVKKLHDGIITSANDSPLLKINLNNITDNSTKKLNSLFDYFLFSNEKDVNKLTSDEYKPLIEYNYTDFDFKLEEYEYKDIIQDEIIKKDDKEYVLYEILPKSYYKFYNKKGDLVIYESKYLGSNYMDVWVEKVWIKNNQRIKKSISITFIIMIFIGIIFIGITRSIFDSFTELVIVCIVEVLFVIWYYLFRV